MHALRVQMKAKNVSGYYTRIFIVNAHSANRGDEAAQRGMIDSIKKLIPNARFRVMAAIPKATALQKDVEVLDKPFTGWSIRSFFELIKQSIDSDIIISAPGGPYFGELYSSHEVVHLFQLLVGVLFRKPLMVFAPSIGPFKSAFRNALRKIVLNQVEIITLREQISQRHLSNLHLSYPRIYVTADLALQRNINVSRADIWKILRKENIAQNKPLIGFVPAGMNNNFPCDRNCKERKKKYLEIISEAADFISFKLDATIIFIPQVYCISHETSLIHEIVERMKYKNHVRVIPEHYDSDIQQGIIREFDFLVTNRYHPTIFAAKMGVPMVCIAYEHKITGFMNALGLEQYVIPIANLEKAKLIAKIEEGLSASKQIKHRIKENIPILEQLSFMNAELAVNLLTYSKLKANKSS